MTTMLALSIVPAAHALSVASLAEHLAVSGDVSGRFEQSRYLADLDTRIEGSGRYRFEQGERVIWQLEKPVKETLELSEAGIRHNGEALQDDPAGVATLIMQLLNGRLAALAERFEIDLQGSEANWHATLRPRQAGLAEYLERIDMRGGAQLENVQMAMADGDRLDIHLLTDTATNASPGT